MFQHESYYLISKVERILTVAYRSYLKCKLRVKCRFATLYNQAALLHHVYPWCNNLPAMSVCAARVYCYHELLRLVACSNRILSGRVSHGRCRLLSRLLDELVLHAGIKSLSYRFISRREYIYIYVALP